MNAKIFGAEEVAPAIQKIIQGIKEKNIDRGETIEMRIGLKGYDMAKDKRFKSDAILPYPKREVEKVLVIADYTLQKALEGTDIPYVLMEDYKGKTPEDKKKRKKLVKSYHSFISVATIFRVFEAAMFARKKKPLYTIKNVGDIKNFYEETKRKVQLKLTADMLIGFSIGTTKMPVEQISQNFSSAMVTLLGLVKKGMQNIRSVHIKSTQGKPIKYY